MKKILLPDFMPRKPFEIYAGIVTSKYLRSKLAQRHGVKDEVVQAWGRPVESDEFPSGTGKANPLDRLLRDMRLSFSMFPDEVREIAEVVRAETERLEDEAGAGDAESNGNPCAAVTNLMQEHLGVLQKLQTGELSDEKLAEIECEWSKFEGSFFKTRGCIRAFVRKHRK